jgi:hypothetical protein
MHGKYYFWCTGDHWSGGTKHNGMYADHNLVIMTLGELTWMNDAKLPTMVNQRRLLHPNPPKVLLRNLLSMTNFAMHFALRLAFLLKQSIESGRMLREMSRSESRVE